MPVATIERIRKEVTEAEEKINQSKNLPEKIKKLDAEIVELRK